jgi:hypothetical protein
MRNVFVLMYRDSLNVLIVYGRFVGLSVYGVLKLV